MQISSVQQSPNFGMALKIKPTARTILENTSVDFINKLNRIGEELKDTKYYSMEIDEKLCPHIYADHGEKYRPPFKISDPSRYPGSPYISLSGVWDGATEAYRSENRYTRLVNGNNHLHNINMGNSDAALAAYNKFNNLDSNYDKAAYVTKLLDNEEKERRILLTPNIVENGDIKKGVNTLLKKFGIKISI